MAYATGFEKTAFGFSIITIILAVAGFGGLLMYYIVENITWMFLYYCLWVFISITAFIVFLILCHAAGNAVFKKYAQ